MGEQKDRLERLTRLLAYLLEAPGPVGRPELETAIPMYENERGRRRFEDDKEALRRAGIPLRADAPEGEGGDWFYEVRRDEYELPDLDLTPEERVALNLAARSTDLTDVAWGRLAGTKLGAYGSEKVATVIELPGVALLPRLQDAVRNRTRLVTTYNGTEREIDPYGLVLKNGNWYLPAFDHHRAKLIPFRVDRMDAEAIDEVAHAAFEVPEGFDTRAAVPDDAVTGIGEDDPVEAVVRVDPRAVPLIDLEVDVGETHVDGVRIHVQVTHVGAFVGWVLSFGELAVVEEPPHLRAAVVARLEELAG